MQVSRPQQSSISNLLNSLKKSVVNDSQLQLSNLQKAHKVSNRQSKHKQQHEYRKANYEMISSNMDKWVPIIKVNREKQHIDFTQKSNNQVRVTFFPSNDNNPLTKRIEDKLNNIGVASESQLQKQEQKILQTLDPEDAKQRVNQAIKRSTAFYQEIKRKRISKIKSKLYRKIKKRQKQKQELAKFDTLGPEQKEYQIQKLRNKRIKERISLRHKIKNKHIQDLMRFQKGDKNTVQNSINQLNKIRRQQLEKLNDEILKDMSEEYDDENFRQQALEDIEQQMQMLEEEQRAPEKTGLKFMDKANKARIQKEKKEAARLRQMLVESDAEIQISDQQDEDNENSDDQKPKKKSKRGQQMEVQQEPFFRKKYDKQNKKGESKTKKVKGDMKDTLENYITQKRVEEDQPSQRMQVQQPQSLIKGINISNLKNKYQPKRVEKINMQELVDNNPQLFDNFEVLQNRRQFQAQKNKEYEQQLPEQPKVVKGWDSWTGPGIAEVKIDSKKELEKKLKQIEEIRRKRKDGMNQDVIIRENRNKTFARDYLVSQLPYNYTSKQQFDYVHQQPVGPEWNSLSNFQQSIKPKIKTKAGETVQPITLPKKIAKLQ